MNEMDINDFIKKNKKNVLELQNRKLADGSEVPLLHFSLLEDTGIVEHCFTTRIHTGYH